MPGRNRADAEATEEFVSVASVFVRVIQTAANARSNQASL